MTPPLGFSTLTPIPGANANELPPITVSTFIATSPENTPLTHRASTYANPDPMINPAFVEANYEACAYSCQPLLTTTYGSYLEETFKLHFPCSWRFHEEQCISGFVYGLRTKSLVEFLSTNLPTTYKGLMEKTYTWIEAREVATNGTPNDHRESIDRFKKNSSCDNNKGKKNRDMLSSYHGSNHGLLSNLSKSSKEILATENVAKTFKQPPRLPESRRSRDMSKYCHFHKDHRHDINQCRELRHQIEEAIRSGQLAHLVKGMKKGKEKVSDTQLSE
uniref:Reverse transcriptase domain-containing protein n=1 Tax=Tanacetum cinerariifolium TaxID=118510 RepID=A0A6L2JGJ9_TANCI|nr:reverse transcriptase domain-containing protein [Tanacetum cinerariifolium]